MKPKNIVSSFGFCRNFLWIQQGGMGMKRLARSSLDYSKLFLMKKYILLEACIVFFVTL